MSSSSRENSLLPEATSSASSPPTHPHSLYTSSCSTSVMGDNSADRDNEEEEEVKKEESTENALSLDEMETQQRLERLQHVLKQSAVYSRILGERMEEEKAKQRERRQAKEAQRAGQKRSRSAAASRSSPRKKAKGKANTRHNAPELDAAQDVDEGDGSFQQPALITGAKLKDYQLDGVQWMVSLDQNGISGILADEMGLGKTLQTIAFNAYLRERGNQRPFLIVCPLSVVHNWADEYAKFAPSIPVCVYHGTQTERAELRETVLAPPGTKRQRSPPPKYAKSGRHKRHSLAKEEEESEEEVDMSEFPVILTTYEMVIIDRKYLSQYDWGYIVVDEGHRLKNFNCRLMQVIKKFKSAGRMLLTGTPLHNNLGELWSLLNFILPDIFNDVDAFQSWFNLPELQSSLPTSQSEQIISALHSILKPFLLRRMKVDVDFTIPPKKEYVLYAPLSKRQREAYDRVILGMSGIRQWLIEGGTGNAEAGSGSGIMVDSSSAVVGPGDVEGDVEEDEETKPSKRPVRRAVKKALGLISKEEEEEESKRIGMEYQMRQRVIKVNNMRLKNRIMQLRKVCSHPFLFEWPLDQETGNPVLGEELLNASGKMMVLDRLLQALFKKGHKVLIFSQFKTMLDIIEDWATDHMGWNICRIDGSTKGPERREQMRRFQTGGDAPDAPKLFLLSTRAGGLGITLTAADTVIFYDQDWNPQMDAQAQDRAHRIGQTKPVLIYRLVTAHTIEARILQRATAKRRLEAMVIAKGKFRMPASNPHGDTSGGGKGQGLADLAAEMLKLEGEKIEVVPDTKEGKESVLSERDLEMLLDRSPEVFKERNVGWTSTEAGGGSGAGRKEYAKEEEEEEEKETMSKPKATFAVYETPAHEGNDALGVMDDDLEDE